MKVNFKVEGMSCSACSAAVEKAVGRVQGVTSVSVSLLEGRMICELDGPEVIEKVTAAVDKAGFVATYLPDKKSGAADAQSAKSDAEKEKKSPYTDVRTRLIVSICCTVPLMYVSMGHMLSLPFTGYFHEVEHAVSFFLIQLLLTLPVLYVNRVFFLRGIPALIRRAANMDSLVAVGSSAAVIYGVAMFFVAGEALGRGDHETVHKCMSQLYFESAAMILTLVTVGKYLESRAKRRTGRALERLIDLSPKTATVIRDGNEVTVPADSLVVGDIVVLHPGESVPADGVIVQGSSSFDRSALTGESVPVDLTVGDTVLTASVNISGSIQFRATGVGDDTALSRIIQLVREAGATKAPAARLADKISGIFVPVVMSIAALATIIWLIFGYDLGFALSIGISVLVVSCPCSLGLATPVAVTVAIGRSATDGVLVKSAEALEVLCGTDTVVFDKTGTLTEGKPRVTDILPAGDISRDELLGVAASLESGSEHPLARAVVEGFEGERQECLDFTAVFGLGVSGKIGGRSVTGGNAAYMAQCGVDVSGVSAQAESLAGEGKTPLYFQRDGRLLGVIAVADTPRRESKVVVHELRDLGVRVVMLTGDNHRTAEAVRRRLGIDEVISDVLPDDKEQAIRRLQEGGHKVAMVGDGINDSPALTRADVGISPAAGTDIAIDSADIVLMNDDLESIPRTLRYSKRVMRNIRQNLFWAFFYNSLGIPVAAGVLYPKWGITLSPMIAAAAMSLSSLFVVTNALRLFRTGHKKKKQS